jgi:hypothetical protein
MNEPRPGAEHERSIEQWLEEEFGRGGPSEATKRGDIYSSGS